MKPVLYTENLLAIVYDADRIPEPDARILDAGYWLQQGAVTHAAPGRGTTMMLDSSYGPAVLRRYMRGGLPARLSRETYIFTGIDRSRPFREFEILRRMSACGLPVPAPLAASCEHQWLTYRGGLLMDQIQGASTLAELAESGSAAPGTWQRVGACIRQFHEAGMEHADLNARNILVDQASGKVTLIDFDRSTFDPGRKVNGDRSIARLKRSLEKFWPTFSGPANQTCWQALTDGYHE